MTIFHDVSLVPPPAFEAASGLGIVRRLRALLERLVLERGHTDLTFDLPDWLHQADRHFAVGYGESDEFTKAMDSGVTGAVTFLLAQPRAAEMPIGTPGPCVTLFAAYFTTDGGVYAVRAMTVTSLGTISGVRNYGGFSRLRARPLLEIVGHFSVTHDVTLDQLDRLMAFPTTSTAGPSVCCFCGGRLVDRSVEAKRRVYGRSLRFRVAAPHCLACVRTYLSEAHIRAVDLHELANPYWRECEGFRVSLSETRALEILPWPPNDAIRFSARLPSGRRTDAWWARIGELARQELARLAVPIEFL